MYHGYYYSCSGQDRHRGRLCHLLVSLELSRSTWVATSLAPGSRKMSKHMLVGGEFYGIWTVAVLVEAVIMSN